MRGYIFEVVTKKEDRYFVNHTDFEDEIYHLGVDRIKTLDTKEAEFVSTNFINKLVKYGARRTTNGGFVVTNEMKLNYFRQRFHRFKKAVGNLTLFEFSTSTLDTIKTHILNSFGDVVFDPEGEFEFDDWVRVCEVNQVFYIGNVIQMG